MLDINFIPGQQDNVKVFYASDTNTWQTWTRPRNCKFVWMMCIGGGAAGSNGNQANGNSGTAGGSGAIVKALFPSNVLPDILYVQPGPGGSNNPSVVNPGKSFVSITPSSATIMNIVCTSGNTAAINGGAAETIATVANAGLLSLGSFSAIAGTLTTDFTGGIPLTGGAGAQSSIASINIGTFSTPTINGGAGQLGNAADGNSGFTSWKPFYSIGGAGGGTSSGGGQGGNGGNAGIGSGGGAGGGGFVLGKGFGGKGGDGLVIIATF